MPLAVCVSGLFERGVIGSYTDIKLCYSHYSFWKQCLLALSLHNKSIKKEFPDPGFVSVLYYVSQSFKMCIDFVMNNNT